MQQQAQPQRRQPRPMPQQAPRRTSRPQDMEETQAQANDEYIVESDSDQGSDDQMVVAATNIFEAEEQVGGAREPLSGTAASFIARALDDGLNEAMEVDEFISSVRQKVPESYLQDLVKYTGPEVIASVREHAPRSVALSPGGLEFTNAVMARLRAMYGIA